MLGILPKPELDCKETLGGNPAPFVCLNIPTGSSGRLQPREKVRSLCRLLGEPARQSGLVIDCAFTTLAAASAPIIIFKLASDKSVQAHIVMVTFIRKTRN